MAIKLQLRHDSASNWSSVNPTLSQGEIGCDTTNNIFKIGDGVTAWNSLANAPTGSTPQTIAYQSLGDGSDGNVTISSGVTTMTRDMYYSNLTINGTGSLFTNGYRVFITGILDLTAAPVAAINFNPAAGNNASGSTGGSTAIGTVNGSVGGLQQGGAGATGTTGTGTAGTVGVAGGNGGNTNTTGAGGVGGSGAGGAATASSTSAGVLFVKTFLTNFLRGVTQVLGGSSGRGGSSGAGDGTNAGAGGGSGGIGGGVIALYANIILRSSSTPSGVIEALGGNGGNGANATTGVTGGGGGGAGGGGGWVYIAYNYLAGPVVTSFIIATGGNGGNGGNGIGSAAGIISGGGGGSGGYGGRITLFNIVTQATSEFIPLGGTQLNPETTVGNVGFMSTGGFGGVGGKSSVTI